MAAIRDGRQTVTAAGTAERLTSTSVPVVSVAITAETDNTGLIAVGGSTVVAALATRRGIPLAAGESVTFTLSQDGVDELSDVWIDSTVSGDGVTYAYVEAS